MSLVEELETDTASGHTAKDITPSIRAPEEKDVAERGFRSTIFLAERTRDTTADGEMGGWCARPAKCRPDRRPQKQARTPPSDKAITALQCSRVSERTREGRCRSATALAGSAPLPTPPPPPHLQPHLNTVYTAVTAFSDGGFFFSFWRSGSKRRWDEHYIGPPPPPPPPPSPPISPVPNKPYQIFQCHITDWVDVPNWLTCLHSACQTPGSGLRHSFNYCHTELRHRSHKTVS